MGDLSIVTSGVAFTLLGFGLGALLLVSKATASPRTKASLRDRAIAAQEEAALAARRARELAAQWSKAQDREDS